MKKLWILVVLSIPMQACRNREAEPHVGDAKRSSFGKAVQKTTDVSAANDSANGELERQAEEMEKDR